MSLNTRKKDTLIIFLFLTFLIISHISIATSNPFVKNSQIKDVIVNQSNDEKLTFHPKLNEMLQEVNQSKLYNHIKVLEDFGPHPTESLALENAAEYLYNELENLNYSVQYHHWSYEQRSDKNIIATLPANSSSDSIVIICAHYDTISISPGADDDSSGVASILMIAEILKEYSFYNTIEFVLFSGEEQGLMGSNVYANELFNQDKKILAVLALDKIGYAENKDEGNKINHHTNSDSKWMVKISKMLADEFSNQIQLDIIESPPDPGSDHKSFTDIGFFGSDFVRYAVNPFYHTSEDIIEHMNFTYLTKVCKLALATIVTIAEIDQGLNQDELHISMLGTRLAEPAQFSVGITNYAYPIDTANLTVTIEMKNIFRNKYVEAIKTNYNVPCNWTVNKEITDFWLFQIGGRKYTRGFFKLEVVIEGFNDDITIYKKSHTYGLILNQFKVWMIPKQ